MVIENFMGDGVDQRFVVSFANTFLAPLNGAAARIAENRDPIAPDNPLLKAEHLRADLIQQSMDMARDARDAWHEIMFFSIYATPAMRWFGRKYNDARPLGTDAEPRSPREGQQALLHVETGDFVEAVIRMLVLLADSRGSVRRDRLERAARVLNQDEPFRSLDQDHRARIIHQQTLIVEFAREEAIASPPLLLRTEEKRALAGKIVRSVAGEIEDMAPATLALIQKMHHVPGLPEVTSSVTEDPLRTRGETATA